MQSQQVLRCSVRVHALINIFITYKHFVTNDNVVVVMFLNILKLDSCIVIQLSCGTTLIEIRRRLV